jgi:hypothetical protein
MRRFGIRAALEPFLAGMRVVDLLQVGDAELDAAGVHEGMNWLGLVAGWMVVFSPASLAAFATAVPML